GTGSGTVTSAPAGISCGADCSESWLYGSSVTLTATPAPGSRVAYFEGACTSFTDTCTITVDGPGSVWVWFVQTYPLTVTKAGTASGTVTSAPAGIDCGTSCAQASAGYDSGTSVTLTASAPGTAAFSGWGGACTGTSPTCTVSMTQARDVTAVFDTHTLEVDIGGTADGWVTSTPAVISCPGDCTETFASPTSVTLTAQPGDCSKFFKWTGKCGGANPICTLTVTGDSPVTAVFVYQTSCDPK
ncbi:MAG TPA: hypothetical protein VL172_15575, partial [Kofleriaceae bacterium]|nr:hypothetical protein [Kofleriaceae bacterium]